uniref:axin-1-like n=1 Tax=Myxine glutinosa TaxID=7769 RepID=UPI00358F9E2D
MTAGDLSADPVVMEAKTCTLGVATYLLDAEGNLMQDRPRPPVPGEEGGGDDTGCDEVTKSLAERALILKGQAGTPRRPDFDLGFEPEGSASPTFPPYVRWGESLAALLEDRDGTQLFRAFLAQEGSSDLVDFWYACNGFRNLAPERMAKAARLIYKRYVGDATGAVAARLGLSTRTTVRDIVTGRGSARRELNAGVFDQAQSEVQRAMEENAYPAFLKSDVYLEYVRAGSEESPCPQQLSGTDTCNSGSGSGSGAATTRYLPTLNEDEEWVGDEEVLGVSRLAKGGSPPCLAATEDLGLRISSHPHRLASWRFDGDASECHPGSQVKPAAGFGLNAGQARAPASSANDSEQSVSSDATTTDDALSVTDSSVDGMPIYRFKKVHRREMHRSVKANGRVVLPHFPRTSRLPKEMGPVDPCQFAAQLISKLELVKKERDAQQGLEERLQRLREEEDGTVPVTATAAMTSDSSCSSAPPLPPPLPRDTTLPPPLHPFALLLRPCEPQVQDDPESILDEHVSRVLRTPGTRSPERSPGHNHHHHHYHRNGGNGSFGAQPLAPFSRPPVHRPHVFHHHHVHHHGTEDEVGPRPGNGYANGNTSRPVDATYYGKGIPAEELDRACQIWQWMMDGERESGRHKKVQHGTTKRGGVHDGIRGPSGVGPVGSPVERMWCSTQPRRGPQPNHLFVQDPAMPPPPAPNTTVQLEEAKRRLEEDRRAGRLYNGKQRHVQEVIQRGRHVTRPGHIPFSTVVPAVSGMEISHQDNKTVRRTVFGSTVVAYYFCGEPIPYRTTVGTSLLTLGQFKELLTKKGHYRYYFKKASDEFECGVVFEEVKNDTAVLPLFEEKIVGKVEKVD